MRNSKMLILLLLAMAFPGWAKAWDTESGINNNYRKVSAAMVYYPSQVYVIANGQEYFYNYYGYLTTLSDKEAGGNNMYYSGGIVFLPQDDGTTYNYGFKTVTKTMDAGKVSQKRRNLSNYPLYFDE